jgi:CHAT domain-containing protein/Tfp pilus assembly protein PilF
MSLRPQILTVSLLILSLLYGMPHSIIYAGAEVTEERSYSDSVMVQIAALNNEISVLLAENAGTERTEKYAVKIEEILASGNLTDTLIISDAYYWLGHHYLTSNSYNRAIECFALSGQCRQALKISDRRYALGLSNTALALFWLGDFPRAYEKGIEGLITRRALLERDSSELAGNYLNLSSICLEMDESEKAIGYAEAGLNLTDQYPDKIDRKVKADLYQVIGLSLYRNLEYTKSLVYCREALRLYDPEDEKSIASRLLIFNTISQLYRRLNQPADAEKYFREGLAIKAVNNTQDKNLLFINYADFLAGQGRNAESKKVIEDALSTVRKTNGTDSREYCLMYASGAEILYSSRGETQKALEIYNECFHYVETHPWDEAMKRFILVKYAGTLFEAGLYRKVLEVSNDADFQYATSGESPRGTGPAVRYSEEDMEVLLLRYRALNALAKNSAGDEYLREAIATGRMIVTLYDYQRTEMSEEESRTNLSAASREVYSGMIANYLELYELHHDHYSLDGLFEFSERSKVAGFLTSMREVNAAKFSLPADLVNLDNNLRRETGLYRELINSERAKAIPDSQRIATWESVAFSLLRKRDSLLNVFEEKYPSYYNLKFSSKVTPLAEVKDVIGRKANLLSYVMTFNKLYIIVTNRRKTEIITRDIDSTLISSLRRYREMLSEMPATSSVRKPFNEFMDLSLKLYRILLEPAIPYLRGDKIVISPDNIIAYIPFETLITEEFRSPGLLYRDAPFALKDYRFSYIYSVTLSSETERRSRSIRNDLAAFAPNYEGMELNDSLLTAYPGLRGEIRGLPYALLEAEDAVKQCGGKAFLARQATEEAYKSEAQSYEIIHLAMHTLVDDKHPAFSKMIFSRSEDSVDDGLLNTYEVYTVPLNAMMVVLSSCNTGTGMLVTGEGILSLARGFLYAGSRSVVMSMWTVEDASASSLIRSFYSNMRKGQTKSEALRTARLKFLRTADQERSHPYYWSTLVVYGDDTPLWFSSIKLYSSLLIMLVVTALLVASVYRGPRS